MEKGVWVWWGIWCEGASCNSDYAAPGYPVYFLKVINAEVARALLIKPEACDLWHGERVTTQSGYRRIQWGLNYLAISLILVRSGSGKSYEAYFANLPGITCWPCL